MDPVLGFYRSAWAFLRNQHLPTTDPDRLYGVLKYSKISVTEGVLLPAKQFETSSIVPRPLPPFPLLVGHILTSPQRAFQFATDYVSHRNQPVDQEAVHDFVIPTTCPTDTRVPAWLLDTTPCTHDDAWHIEKRWTDYAWVSAHKNDAKSDDPATWRSSTIRLEHFIDRRADLEDPSTPFTWREHVERNDEVDLPEPVNMDQKEFDVKMQEALAWTPRQVKDKNKNWIHLAVLSLGAYHSIDEAHPSLVEFQITRGVVHDEISKTVYWHHYKFLSSISDTTIRRKLFINGADGKWQPIVDPLQPEKGKHHRRKKGKGGMATKSPSPSP